MVSLNDMIGSDTLILHNAILSSRSVMHLLYHNSQPLQMNLTARPQHQVPVYVEHFNGGIGLVEFLQTLYQFGVVIHVDG